MESKTSDKITNAISSILGELGAVKKDGENKFQRFSYTSYDEFNSHIKPLLSKYNVAIMPSTEEILSHDQIGKTKSGSAIYSVVIKMTFDVRCGEESCVYDWVAQGRCESGKEIAKAQTEGTKRFEMKLFHSSTKNDIDPEGEAITVNVECISDEQIADLEALISEVGADRGNFLNWCRVQNIEDIPKNKYTVAVQALESKRAEK